MAAQKQLEKSAAKAAAAIKGQAIQSSAWANLMDTTKKMGLALSLAALGCSCTVSHADKRPQTSLIKPHIELKGITGDYYTMNTGEVSPVFVSPQGKYFVMRPNGRKYYPKKLNK